MLYILCRFILVEYSKFSDHTFDFFIALLPISYTGGEVTVILSIFYSEEKDQAWHKTQQVTVHDHYVPMSLHIHHKY